MTSGTFISIAMAPVLGAVAFLLWRLKARGSRAALAKAAASPQVGETQRKAPAKPKPAQPSKVDPVASAEAAAEIRVAVHRIAFDAPNLGAMVPTAHAKIANEILVALEDAVTQDRYMPRRPRMIPELMRAVNDADSSWRHISTLVARDPALAADLLRIANSAFYRITEDPIESIDRAVAVLGTNGVRTAISAAVMQPVFKVVTAHFRSFPQTVWDHAFMSGIAAETAAALIEDEDPFAAQLLALLMGLGAIVVFRVAEDRYKAESALAPSAEAFSMIINLQAGAVARRIAESWELSERMITALNDQSAAARGVFGNLSALGRAVLTGQRLGAIGLLLRAGRLPFDTAQAAAIAQGVPPVFSEQLLKRLSK